MLLVLLGQYETGSVQITYLLFLYHRNVCILFSLPPHQSDGQKCVDRAVISSVKQVLGGGGLPVENVGVSAFTSMPSCICYLN